MSINSDLSGITGITGIIAIALLCATSIVVTKIASEGKGEAE